MRQRRKKCLDVTPFNFFFIPQPISCSWCNRPNIHEFILSFKMRSYYTFKYIRYFFNFFFLFVILISEFLFCADDVRLCVSSSAIVLKTLNLCAIPHWIFHLKIKKTEPWVSQVLFNKKKVFSIPLNLLLWLNNIFPLSGTKAFSVHELSLVLENTSRIFFYYY